MRYKEINVKEQAKEKKLPQSTIDFIKDLRQKIEKDDTDRAQWKDKMIAAQNQRQGIKRASNYPYRGAPDFPLPETDKLIEKQTPNLILSAWAVKKLCTVEVEAGVMTTPELQQKAKKAEDAMNLILREKMDLYTTLSLAADYAKEKGHCVFRVVEKFKKEKIHKVINLEEYEQDTIKELKKLKDSELEMFLSQRFNLSIEDEEDQETIKDVIKQFRKGKTIIEFDLYNISSLPMIEAPLPTKIIVPTYTTDISKATRITYEYFKPRHELEEAFENKVYIRKDLSKLDISGEDSDEVEQQKRLNEGVTDNTSENDLYRIHEVLTWKLDEDKDCYERMVYVFLADVDDPELALLKEMKFPFEFDGWNYAKYDNELKDARYYNSRGIPEKVSAMQEILERSINNMLIRDEHNNNPIYEVLKTSDYLDRVGGIAPGEKIPVDDLGSEIRRLDNGQIPDVSSERIMSIVKAYTEEYQHSTDQLFRNATNMGGGKTLGEIQYGVQQMQGPMEVGIIRWNETLSKVYTMVFKIMQERLGDSIWINGNEITKEDFNFPATVKCNGSVEVADKNIATQKAYMRMRTLIELLKTNTCVNPDDIYNATKDWLDKDGAKNPDEFCTDPKIMAQQTIVQMQQQIMQMQQQMMMMNKTISEQQQNMSKNEQTKKKNEDKFKGKMDAITEEAMNNVASRI